MDFVCLSCDTITNYPPHRFLDIFRLQSPTFACIVAPALEVGLETSNTKKDEEFDTLEYTAIDPTKSRLLMSLPRIEMDDDDDEDEDDRVVKLRMTMLETFGVVSMSAKLRDAHAYVFKKWVAEFVKEEFAVKNVTYGIKEDLIPLLVKAQYSQRVFDEWRLGHYLSLPADLSDEARARSSTGGGFVGTKENELLCTAVVVRDGHAFRAKTSWTYLEGNRLVAKSITEAAASATIAKGAQVGPDSLVGHSTTIGEKTSVKKSVIGNHCVIGKNVKLAGTVIMDHGVIEDNASLTNCIICTRAKVEESAVLKECQVAPGVIVEKEARPKGGEIFEQEILE
ncbi:Eukaryotic translation initiation factor 2B, subunit 3 gamma, 58kDa [Irineochytrium annulatum]|nr:Eukaryotic translation initiation factor 2B, subunit 3 gamma, 58kDa [Irineochytrium annulatum]